MVARVAGNRVRSSSKKKIRTSMLRRTLRAAVMAGLLSLSLPANATEGGGTSKPPGIDTVRTGILTPPGWFVLGTLSTYEADRFLDSSGNDRAGISNFDLTASAFALRADYVWPGVKWLGADVGTRGGVAAYVDAKLAFDVQTPGGRVPREDSDRGVGDSFFAPILLGWHGESVHQIATAMVFLPTGSFDRAKVANTSRGYYAFSPAYYVTWFPTPAVEVTGSFFYLLNKENSDTRYKSGNELSIDYGMSYEVARGWHVGANGYWYQQVTDDKQSGVTVGDGNRGKAFAIGPFLRHSGKGWGVLLKWQREASVENRAKGDRFYLQVSVKL